MVYRMPYLVQLDQNGPIRFLEVDLVSHTQFLYLIRDGPNHIQPF